MKLSVPHANSCLLTTPTKHSVNRLTVLMKYVQISSLVSESISPPIVPIQILQWTRALTVPVAVYDSPHGLRVSRSSNLFFQFLPRCKPGRESI